MSYYAPYIDETGLHVPSYKDIIEELISSFKEIYGNDIYIEPDSQDYQMLSVFSLMLYDNFQFLETVFNSYSVKTAEGTALDNLVKLNGIARKAASYSTADLTLSGTRGTVIEAGRVADSEGNIWVMDHPAIIGADGTATGSATCQTLGAIPAAPNTITSIMNPQRGWTGATNDLAAVEGNAVETDAELKLRQTNSVAAPSKNMVGSLYSEISALENVKSCKIYENDTSQTDVNGIPGHSIACIVEGGDSKEIAESIYRRKGPGTGTHGSTEITLETTTGDATTIKFMRPESVSVDISITITPSASFTSNTEAAIRSAISEYFENIKTGSDVLMSSIIAVASRAVTDLYNPEFTVSIPVLIGESGDTLYASDFAVDFNQRATLGTLEIGGLS